MSVSTNLPIIALRGMTILPYMVIHFDVSRKKSIKSLEYAMKNGQKIFLVAQLYPDTINPERKDVYDVGTICEIKQLVKMPGGLIRVLVRGLERAVLDDFTSLEGPLMGDVITFEDEENLIPGAERDARVSLLKDMMKRYYIDTARNQGDNIARLKAICSLNEITYTSLSECTTDYVERQDVLNIEDIIERFDAVCDIVCDKIEEIDIKKKLTESVRKRVDQNQKEYFLREQIQAIKEELGDDNVEDEIEEFRKATNELEAAEEVKDKILREIRRYENMSSNSSESNVVRNYIETMLELPWDKYSVDCTDIDRAEQILEEDHYGLAKVKQRMVEFLAVRALTEDTNSPIVCLVGPPGTGKTSIVKSVAKAIDRKYVRICLGGVRDEAEIRGHRKTYVGAMPGRIIEGLKQAGTGNPLMLLDEIDKVGSDSRGDTASALLEVLDGEQNSAFRDHYIEMPVNLSHVLFMATANDISTIPKPLLDRMEVIEINSYTATEKFHIAKNYLVKKQMENTGLKRKQISFTDDAIRKIINSYTREAGVRELERMIGAVCRRVAKAVVSGEQLTHRITVRNLENYLESVKYIPENKSNTDQVGLVKGLAWTSVGGTSLDVEAILMPGKGVLTITGKLGDVMMESSKVAFAYVRSIASKYGVKPEIFEKNDFNIHFPEGAVPKDGPSAGITISLAILSAVTGRKVDCNIAMTGEVTLHGKVLPIGGLKEKLLAAGTIGIKKVLIPNDNTKDLAEIEQEILDMVEIVPVKTMQDVIKYALKEG